MLKFDGHMVITVPHQFLSEKKTILPSRYNRDHKRFYTPEKLIMEIEQAFKPNSYRIEVCYDHAENFDYSIPPNKHSQG